MSKNLTQGFAGLRERRRKLGLSQEGLAKAARCSQKTIYRLENGATNATQALIDRLCEVLDCTYEQLKTPPPPATTKQADEAKRRSA